MRVRSTPCQALPVAFAALLGSAAAQAAQPTLPACLAGEPVDIVVRIGDGAARSAWLRGGLAPALQVIDAQTAQPLWTAAAWPPASQLFGAMQAQFAGSLRPVDLDGDGVHDRLYAGDLGGRVWRFDLHHGEPAQRWATGAMLADFSAGGPLGFIAAPDVSLHAGPSAEATWLEIALGTARLGVSPVENRFYVLRDHSAFESWPQGRYDRWRPLREPDLVQLPRPGAGLSGPAPDGYFMLVGSRDILSPSITVSGRATLALAEPGSALGGRCAVTVVVSAIDLATGAQPPSVAGVDTSAPPARIALRAGESFTFQRDGNLAACLLGGIRIPSCDADLSPRRRWWRREDAD